MKRRAHAWSDEFLTYVLAGLLRKWQLALPSRYPPRAGNKRRRDPGTLRPREVFREQGRRARRLDRPK